MTEFDLFIESDGSLLAVSSQGVARERSSIPLSDAAFMAACVRVASREKGVTIREQVGKQLFDGLFHGDVLAAWAKSSGDPDGARLRLVVDGGGFAELPWELLYDGTNFLATDAHLAVSRYIPMPEPVFLPVTDKLKVLLVTASPASLPTIATEEVDALAAAIGEAASVTVVRGCTPSSLADAIATNECHVLHFLGHGTKGSLILEGATNADAEAMSDRAFAQAVFGRTSIRLVVLSACSSAQTATGGVFSGVGPALIRTRIPAVVAMQYEFVQLSTAQAFNRRFYKEIGAGVQVDVAVNRARNAISTSSDLLEQRDWSTPVLFLGTLRGRLITLKSDLDTQVGNAAQSVQAAVMKNAAAAEGWHELQQTFEMLRASHLALAALAGLRDLLGETREGLDEIGETSEHGVGADEFKSIQHDWGRLNSGTVQRLRDSASRIDDPTVQSGMRSLFDRLDAIDRAIMHTALGDLEREIPAARRTLAEQGVVLGGRIGSRIADLVAMSERTLGKLSAQT